MFIQAFPSGPFDTNAYVIGCQHSKKAAIIDPGFESAEQIERCLIEHEFTPTAIYLTHTHWDHIGNAAKLKEKFTIPVWVHELDRQNLENPGSDGLPLLYPLKKCIADKTFDGGDQLHIGEYTFTVIHTPGHTPGGVCFYCEKEGILISGDTLFRGSIGNLSFPTAEPEKMWESLEKLSSLPPDTTVYPGHGPSTVLRDEAWLPEAKKIFGYHN